MLVNARYVLVSVRQSSLVKEHSRSIALQIRALVFLPSFWTLRYHGLMKASPSLIYAKPASTCILGTTAKFANAILMFLKPNHAHGLRRSNRCCFLRPLLHCPRYHLDGVPLRPGLCCHWLGVYGAAGEKFKNIHLPKMRSIHCNQNSDLISNSQYATRCFLLFQLAVSNCVND